MKFFTNTKQTKEPENRYIYIEYIRIYNEVLKVKVALLNNRFLLSLGSILTF